MAIEYYGFFDSTQEDARVYTGADMERYTNVLSASGVRDADSLRVETADDGLKVRIGYGSALVGGHFYALEDDGGGAAVRTLEAPVSKSRIDRVILRMNGADTARSVSLMVLKGEESDSPQPPALTRAGDAYDISLARIALGVGASIITAAQITDERAERSVCGVLQDVTPQEANALAQEAKALALAAQAASDAAALSAQDGLSQAQSAKSTACAALEKAAGAHYWSLGPVSFLLDGSGWTYDSENDRYYQDVSVSGMTAEMTPFVTCAKVGGHFPLCGCESLASAVRIFLTDLPVVSATVVVYGMGVKA